MKTTVLININSRSGGKAATFFKNQPLDIVLCKDKNATYKILKSKLKEKKHLFIICGGDGTINNFVNAYMKLTVNERKNLLVGLIPCGKANDLANELKLPLAIEHAYRTIKKNNHKEIDIIKANKKHFITGGGLGLSALVASKANKLSKNKLLIKLFKSHSYSLLVVKSILLGYKPVTISQLNGKKIGQEFMTIALHNQETVGKRFKLTPKARNNDGLLDICLIKKRKGILGELIVLLNVLKGSHIPKKATHITAKKASITTNSRTYLMGDGEILDYAKEFEIKVIPKAIKILR